MMSPRNICMRTVSIVGRNHLAAGRERRVHSDDGTKAMNDTARLDRTQERDVEIHGISSHGKHSARRRDQHVCQVR